MRSLGVASEPESVVLGSILARVLQIQRKTTIFAEIMKKTLLLIIVTLCTVLGTAQESKASLLRKSLQMERLRKDGRWLEAMDTATLILTYDKDYRTAVDFVHRYWDKTMQLTDERLQRLSDDESLTQAEERCEIYRVLDEVHDNLRDIRMPLYGPNQKWVWQPEVGYYTGHYDSERLKTFRLLLRKADEALRSYDAEAAMEYYRLALNKYLITDGEKRSNRKDILNQCNGMIDRLCDSERIYDSIFAFELCNMSLEINSDQPEIRQRQTLLQKNIASMYQQMAAEALQAGDSIQAHEYQLSADDWRYNEEE